MIKKTFKAETLSEAIDAIKKTLGSKAQIVATKKVPPRKTILRTLPGYVELTATVDERFLTGAQLDLIANEPGMIQREQNKQQASKKKLWPNFFSIPKSLNKDPNMPTEREKILLEKLEGLQSENTQLQEEMSSLKEDLSQQSTNSLDSGSSLPRAQKMVMEYLKNKGLSQYLLDCLEEGLGLLPQNLSYTELLDASVSYFLQKFEAYPHVPKVCAFVGLSGSGKSSMVMKLALELKREKKRVAIFSLDGDISSSEPMKIFAEKRRIPFDLLHQIRSFKNALLKYHDYDHVLIDMPSLCPNSSENIKYLKKRIEAISAEVFVVCSSHDSANDHVWEVTQHFNPTAVCVTKIDEIKSIAPLMNFIYEYQCPLSYFGIGPKLDSDIEMATPERLIDLFFRFNDSEQGEMAASHEQREASRVGV